MSLLPSIDVLTVCFRVLSPDEVFASSVVFARLSLDLLRLSPVSPVSSKDFITLLATERVRANVSRFGLANHNGRILTLFTLIDFSRDPYGIFDPNNEKERTVAKLLLLY